MNNLTNSTRKKAEDLVLGEKFVALHLTGRQFFGIRSQMRLPGTEDALWYTDLEAGEVAVLPGLLEVEVLSSFVDIIVRVHERELKSMDSLDDVIDFLGINDLDPFPTR